jgi:single-strand DNA-binding protein
MDIANITVVGNALNTPEWRRFERTNALVANFKIASTARRFDRVNGRWIDGDNLRVRVNCWRRLAEGVVASVKVGDPVIVTGRMYTRDWTTEDGQRRSTYELEATSIGHDLGRGVAAFKRGRVNVNTTMVEDAETDKHVQGEPTSVASEENARSEAFAATVGEELRAMAGADFPNVGKGGYDSPVNAERVAMEDLQTVVSDEMRGDLDTLIVTAQRKLGPTTTLDPADPPPSDGDGVGEGIGDEAAEAAVEAVPTSTGEPTRDRRRRTRVGANA